jgi:hypothetical protein
MTEKLKEKLAQRLLIFIALRLEGMNIVGEWGDLAITCW